MLFSFFFLLSACDDTGLDHKDGDFISNLDLKTLQNQKSLPGLAAAIIKNGELSATYVGNKRIETDSPLNAESRFHLGSCTKAMTATLAAILIEDGLLDWDSKLSELLPEIELHTGYAQATFEMLLSHRTGLITDGPEIFFNDWLFKALQSPLKTPPEARDLYANVILKLPPRSTPGSTFNYSNGGYMIAAHILEKLAGKSWETLMREKIFNPLNMKSCGFGPTWGHYRNGPTIHSVFADNPLPLAPAAGVHCTLGDWGKFLSIHLEQSALLETDSFQKLHTVSANDGHDYTFGGWIKVYRDWAHGTVLTHNGSNTWNYAQVYIVPHKNVILMSTTNIGGQEAVEATDGAIGQLIKHEL